jgi:serine/threonine protein kinase/formylglycine-generating enzyme required for sulfatase activity
VAAISLAAGTTISHFRLEKKLGEGGMGAVYLAEDLTLSRRVAIKFMSRGDLGQQANTKLLENLEQRFIREAKSAAAINHPNVAQIYEANFESENWYIAMEFIDGKALSERLAAGPPFAVAEVVQLLTQTVSGLKFAWDHYKIVHRDIKPQNIMLTREQQVKIVDLGLAKPVASSDPAYEMPELTGAGVPVGTPQYMAPEQAAGEPEIDQRADIFALGATVYELLTGQKAFTEKTAPMIYMAQMKKKYVPIPQLRPEVPAELVALVDRMLEPNKSQRVGRYEEILQPLLALAGQLGVSFSGLPPAVTASGTIPLQTSGAGRTGDPEVYPLDHTLVNRYKVVKHLGKSRAGVVYLCVDMDNKRDCAVKVLKPGREFPAESMGQVQRNFERLKGLQHPHLVQILDLHLDSENGELLVAMELLRGQNLRQYTHHEVTRHGTLTAAQLAPVLQRVAAALESVAAKVGFAHGDLKPESVYLVENDTRVKLLDYGVTETPQAGPVVEGKKVRPPLASPDYMAPERWRGEPLTRQADQYSLGVIAYEMLARRLPFWLKDQQTATTQLGASQLASEVELLRTMSQRVLGAPPPAIEGLDAATANALARALAKQPAERFATTADLAKALAGGAAGGSKLTLMLIAAGVAVVALLGALLVYLLRPAPPADQPPTPAPPVAIVTPPVAPVAPTTPVAAPLTEAVMTATIAVTPPTGPNGPTPEQLAQQAALLAKAKQEVQRQQARFTELQQKLAANPRAELFLPGIAEARAAAEAAAAKDDAPAALAAWARAIDAVQNAEVDVQRLAKEEAQAAQTKAVAALDAGKELLGLDPAVDELKAKADVSLALARDNLVREQWDFAIGNFRQAEAAVAAMRQAAQRFTATPGQDFTVAKAGLEMVWLADLKLWAGRYEVTNGQFRKFQPTHSSKKTEDGFSLDGEQQPVCWVKYFDGVAFCTWLTATAQQAKTLPEGYAFRLPTADEWKALARCGKERVYPWGNAWPPPYGNFANQEVFPKDWKLDGYTDEFPATCDVAKSGKNEWGLHGLAGNVWEWTTEEKDGKRAVYGGSWSDVTKLTLVINIKGYNFADPSDTYDNIGFRVLLAPTAK